MVYSDFKKGIMICKECGGTCPLNTDNYDDIMHDPTCNRVIMLDFWKNNPELKPIYDNMDMCLKRNMFIRELIDNPFPRSCPAFYSLLNVIPDKFMHFLPLSVDCKEKEECYKKYCKKHEDYILEISI